MDAFILAAGRGERLRPLTDHTPKPLIEVGGKPLIEHHIERLRDAGFTRVVVNVAWLAERIMAHLGDGERLGVEIIYSREPEGALETAGGIVNALEHLESDNFLLVNADVWTDFAFAELVPDPKRDAGLVLVENPAHRRRGDFALTAHGLRPLTGGEAGMTYAGIGWYRRSLFASLAPGRRPLRPVLLDAIGRRRVSGQRHPGLWVDVGTRERLAQANRLASESLNTSGKRRE